MDLDDLDVGRRPIGLFGQLRAQERSVQIGAVVLGIVLLALALLDRSSPSPAMAEVATALSPGATVASSPAWVEPSAPEAASGEAEVGEPGTVPGWPVLEPSTAVSDEVVSAPDPRDAVVAFALAQVGRPYRFGAAGPEAFDCSGLTRAAYLVVDVDLPHYATWQASHGTAVDWRSAAIERGDLVFTRGGRPRHDLGHVGQWRCRRRSGWWRRRRARRCSGRRSRSSRSNGFAASASPGVAGSD